MPILQRWEKNCPVGHALFISDCYDCYTKKINMLDKEISELKEKLDTLPTDKYVKGQHLFNE